MLWHHCHLILRHCCHLSIIVMFSHIPTPVRSCCSSLSSVRSKYLITASSPFSNYSCIGACKHNFLQARLHCRLTLRPHCQLVATFLLSTYFVSWHSGFRPLHFPTPVRSCCLSSSSVQSKFVCGIIVIFFRTPSGFNL